MISSMSGGNFLGKKVSLVYYIMLEDFTNPRDPKTDTRYLNYDSAYQKISIIDPSNPNSKETI